VDVREQALHHPFVTGSKYPGKKVRAQDDPLAAVATDRRNPFRCEKKRSFIILVEPCRLRVFALRA